MAQGLIIPVNVQAFCVSNADQRATTSFRCATADFSAMPYFPNDNYDSGQVINQGPCTSTTVLTEKDTTAWDPGVHLHWALPDALASGAHDNDSETTNFPTVPNRWLVTRLVTRNGSVVESLCQSWVVESDQLSTTYPQAEKSWPPVVTVPTQPQDYQAPTTPPGENGPWPAGLQAYQYLGNFYSYGQWSEGQGAAYLYQKPTCAPYKLTAICYGNPTFSGFYPDCASVFGFFDRAADLASVQPGDSLAYHVVGWYYTDGTGDDPLDGAIGKPAPCPVPSADDLASNSPAAQDFSNYLDSGPKFPNPQPPASAWTYIEALKWLFTAPADNPVQFSLFNGLVKDIHWDPSQSYAPPSATNTQIAIGNTGAEAISALAKWLLDSKSISAADVEEILNALQLGILPDYKQPGWQTEYAEALHGSHFGSNQGGLLWQVTRAGSDDQSEVTLPPDQSKALNDLNTLQVQTDGLQQELRGLGRQLFADWCKYQVFMRTSDQGFKAWATEDPDTAKLVQGLHDNPTSPMALIQKEIQSYQDTKAQLQTNQGTISTQVAALKQQLGSNYQLLSVPAPKYWHPNDPVLLLSGDLIEPVLRYGGDGRLRPQDGYLECRLTSEVLSSSAYTLGTNSSLPHAAEISALVAEAALEVNGAWPPQPPQGKKFPPDEIGVTTWKANPWLPLLLEWTVEYRPAVEMPHENSTATYPTDLVTAHYALNDTDTDLIPQDTLQAADSYTYTNRVILSPHPAPTLKAAVTDYLASYKDLNSTVTDTLTKVQGCIDDANAPLKVLAQCLGGFNRRLLMGHQVMQLGIADPMWWITANDQGPELGIWADCATLLSDASHHDVAPDEINNFSPIRAGYLQWTKLRLVGVFGRVVDVSNARPIVAASLVPPDPGLAGDNMASLAPRFTQPSRFLFDWLSASSGDVEYNGLPASSPICGWILFNHLDDSLAFYDSDGDAIGSLMLNQDRSGAIWQGAPGSDSYASSLEDSFANQDAHLKSFALGIKQNGAQYLEALLLTIDKGLRTILPASGAKDPSTAVLISRPLALVRASLSIDLQGGPARSQSWESFQAAADATDPSARTTAQFQDVQLPVILGKVDDLEDGLLGYFVSDDYTQFYTSVVAGSSPNISQPSADTILLDSTGKAVEVSMLVDPRAAVHARVGIVPTEAVQIPPDQVTQALRRMNVTFLTAPVLLGPGPAALPVPRESGGEWSWMSLGPNAAWSTSTPTRANASQTQSYSPQQIVDGWLKLSKLS